MLDSKKIRMLEILDDMITNCQKCSLYSGGRVTPYWTFLSKYVMIGEAPGKEEVENDEPFIGKSGKILWEIMGEYGFRKEEFLIINSVQCRPTDGSKNLKPSIEQINLCREIWKKYIKVLSPYRMILLGNYASGIINGSYGGIVNRNSELRYSDFFDIEYISSVHPNYCMHNKDQGRILLEKSIKKFRNRGTERY